MTEELMVNKETFKGEQDDYDAIREAVEKLSNASQDQFETIKREKWYNRVFDMITFSQKGKKRIAEQVGTIAQAQQIFIELLLRLSANDTHISEIVAESMENIRKIQEQNLHLLSRIKQLENISLGIKPDMDIHTLSDKNKQVLSACLYKISDENANASDEQITYANSIIDYLGGDKQMDNPTAALENMDNESRRKILACCMEYIFLKSCSFDSYDDYKDLIEEFDFGNKTVATIKKQITSLYKLRGCEGFFSKYKSENFNEPDDTFVIEIEDEIEEESEIVMEDEFISSILQIRAGETKTYKNKNLHINAFINCEGNLEIDHCALYYNETNDRNQIVLARDAQLYIKDSMIKCKGFDKNSFISCEGENTICFETTTFVDCAYFLKSRSNCSFSMTRCELRNCYEDFISISVGEESLCDISSNIIIQDGLNDFYINHKAFSPTLITVSSYTEKKVQFRDNTIVEDPQFKKIGVNEKDSDNKLCYFSCDNAAVSNCSFMGISEAIVAIEVRDSKFQNCSKAIWIRDSWRVSEKALIDNCVFENSTNVIDTWRDTRITNCQFVSCYNRLVSSIGYQPGGVNIEFCQFINIKNNLLGGLLLTDIGSIACIIFEYTKKTKANYLKKCIFDGVELDDNFLIAASGSEKPHGTVTYIEECDFRNCSTKRSSGKIIKEDVQYDTLLKKNQDFHANKISNCRGLDKINKEGAETECVEVRTTSTTGNPIGSALTTGESGEVAVIGVSPSLNIFTGVKAVDIIKKKF